MIGGRTSESVSNNNSRLGKGADAELSVGGIRSRVTVLAPGDE
jgi:hypothetical protein